MTTTRHCIEKLYPLGRDLDGPVHVSTFFTPGVAPGYEVEVAKPGRVIVSHRYFWTVREALEHAWEAAEELRVAEPTT